MKKVLFIFAVALTCVACGKKATTEATSETPATVETTVVEEVVTDSTVVVEEVVSNVVAN